MCIENNGTPRGANLRKAARGKELYDVYRENSTMRSQLRSCDFSVSISLSNCEFDVVFAHPLSETRLLARFAEARHRRSVFVFISFIRGIFETSLLSEYSLILSRPRILGRDV